MKAMYNVNINWASQQQTLYTSASLMRSHDYILVWKKFNILLGVYNGKIWDSPRRQHPSLKSQTDTSLFLKSQPQTLQFQNLNASPDQEIWPQLFTGSLYLSVHCPKIRTVIHDFYAPKLQVSLQLLQCWPVHCDNFLFCRGYHDQNQFPPGIGQSFIILIRNSVFFFKVNCQVQSTK